MLQVKRWESAVIGKLKTSAEPVLAEVGVASS